MELRACWQILARRGWIVALLVAVTVAVSAAAKAVHPRAPVYQATMRITVGVVPEQSGGAYYTYDRYYAWLASEYLADDLAEVLRSQAFAQAVAERLASLGEKPAGSISGSTSTGKLHRLITVTVTGSDPQGLLSTAQAAAWVLQERSREFLAQLGSENAAIHIVDPPSVSALPPTLRERLDLPLRAILALAAGVGLALLVDYADDSVREPQDLEAMGLRLLTSVPRRRR